MKRKIIGVTVGSPLPKPNLMQTDPTKGDYVKGKEKFIEQVETGVVKTVNGTAPDKNGNVEIDALPDNAEQIEMLIEADLLPAVHDASGAILTDENGNIILRY